MEQRAVNRFSGDYPRTLDDKNRVTVPSCWRSSEVPSLYAIQRKGDDGNYLVLMPKDEFDRLGDDSVKNLSAKEAQRFRRMFFAMAKECPIDKSGRVLLPQGMVGVLGDDRDVVLLGVGARIEVWNAANWTKLVEDESASFDAMADSLGI
ncbi:division/cell wall cluster transcriptional repressor MraZ [Sulfuriroseicoccus oceanibius]|uniref:Transcriptional regulator MraZ n=1 Tax=Sulfuriroseicoccus oceanibius TaxID=2707525 RepID=A0A6B3LCL6_9BACT|nr:hypothetical protein [Sulfuriroseicoccus oceanibius]QQL44706.1 hypothetical protein G3M56_012585 [Sulfuriroseicoccus oceanibius]